MSVKSKYSLRWSRALVTVVVLLTVITSLAVVGVSADSADFDREINQTEVAPGESTNITVTVVAPNGSPAVVEEFNRSISNVTIRETNPETVAEGVKDDNTGVAAVWEETNSANITYELTISNNATEGDTIKITGEAGASLIKIKEQEKNNAPSGGGGDGGNGGGGGGDGGNGGGGGGGVGDSDDPELSVELFGFDDYTTIRLEDIPQSSEADIDTEDEVVGDPFTVSGIWMDFRLSPEDFRIEVFDPRIDPNDASRLPGEAGDAVGYVEFEFIGTDESTISETRVSVSVDDEAIDGAESSDDLVMYQYTSDGWTPLETNFENGTLTAVLSNVDDGQLALAVEPSEEPERETESQKSDETQQEAESQEETEPQESAEPESEEPAELSIHVLGGLLIFLTLLLAVLVTRR